MDSGYLERHVLPWKYCKFCSHKTKAKHKSIYLSIMLKGQWIGRWEKYLLCDLPAIDVLVLALVEARGLSSMHQFLSCNHRMLG